MPSPRPNKLIRSRQTIHESTAMTRWLFTLLTGTLFLSCANDVPPVLESDGGVLYFDARMLRDSQALPDTFEPDAGTDSWNPDVGQPFDASSDTPMDSGDDAPPSLVCSSPDPVGDCVLRVPLGSFGPLTSSCLPRCSASTAATYRACTNNRCRSDALRSDTTRGTSYFIGSARVTTPLDCVSCVSYQEFHCFSLVCTAQVDAYVHHCIATLSTQCDAAIAQVDRCLALLSSTQQATLIECMESADGPPGCFACE